MIAVFALFLSVYGLLNYYFIRKQQNIITSKSLPVCLIKLVMFAVILTPIITFIFARKGMPFWASLTGFTGYSWLAFLFLFFLIHAVADIVLFLSEKLGFKPPTYTAKAIFALTMAICAVIMIYGWHEARDIRVERVVIKTSKLPPQVDEIRIVQLSDIHFSSLTNIYMAEEIRDIIEKEKPDLLISTGDLLDPGVKDFEKISKNMNSISAPMGKYGVTGNHEFISNIEKSALLTGLLGFKLLRNEAVDLDGIINLVGIDDPAAQRFGVSPSVDDLDLLKDLDSSKYTIYLKHRPEVAVDSLDHFDLQLSGHTHAGQIFPFSLLVRIIYPYMSGMYELNPDTKLYVSRGTGTWGPPIRFLAPPEITVFDIKRVAQ